MTIPAPRVLRATDDFQFEWPDPADAHLSWIWDQMHCPHPVSPLGGDLFGRWMMAIMGGRQAVVNGYPYRAFVAPQAPGPRIPPPPAPAAAKPLLRLWEEDHLPLIRAVCASIREQDYDSMSLGRLHVILDEVIEDATRAFSYTFGAAIGFFGPTNALVDFCDQEFGSEGAVRATTMLQGYENESASAGSGLSRLAEFAATRPAVAAALKDGRFDGLERVDGGREFQEELGAYLEEYGWRAETWTEIHKPTWAEDPTIALRMVRRYLADPEHSPAVAHKRALARREQVIADTEARLTPEKCARFRSLVQDASAHVPVSEGRALWQLIVAGVLRIPFLAVGRKLASAGHIAAAEDVFYLYLHEIKELTAGEVKFAAKPLVAERREDMERWRKLIPPRHLGAPPPGVLISMMNRFFGLGVRASEDARVINGIAASAGTAEGRARVILDLSDADRLEAGDILVCPSTAPPWTPLFALAGGVVTDSGGVLSHSAICAREYAIPAVVGTVVGTRKIKDGALIALDGSQGIVRIEAEE
jgi:rifampicin phosphotransferase